MKQGEDSAEGRLKEGYRLEREMQAETQAAVEVWKGVNVGVCMCVPRYQFQSCSNCEVQQSYVLPLLQTIPKGDYISKPCPICLCVSILAPGVWVKVKIQGSRGQKHHLAKHLLHRPVCHNQNTALTNKKMGTFATLQHLPRSGCGLQWTVEK